MEPGSTELVLLPPPHVMHCHQCGQPIDVWEALDFYIGPDPQTGGARLTPPYTRLEVCRSRYLRVLPDEHHMDCKIVQEAHLRMRSKIDSPTLGTLYYFEMGGKFRSAEKGEFRLDVYAFRFSDWDERLPQPRLSFVPDLPNEPVQMFVFFGADVVGNPTPTSWLQFWWSYAVPTRPGRMEVIGWQDPKVTEYELLKLSQGVRVFREFVRVHAPGRPRGSSVRDAAEYLELYRDLWIELNKQPTQDQFIETFSLNRQTLKRNLSAVWPWPWAVFVDQAKCARTVRQ